MSGPLLLFILAQGAAVFVTALALYHWVGVRAWALKPVNMTVSYGLWVGFTLWVFFWGANSYLIFFGLAQTAALSSTGYLIAWLIAPLFKRLQHG